MSCTCAKVRTKSMIVRVFCNSKIRNSENAVKSQLNAVRRH